VDRTKRIRIGVAALLTAALFGGSSATTVLADHHAPVVPKDGAGVVLADHHIPVAPRDGATTVLAEGHIPVAPRS
jgi:hypothetical protein